MNNIHVAATSKRKINIVYHKKTDGTTVHRKVSVYEIKNGMLWATCGSHKNAIHQFILDRIESVELTTERYRPKWEVKI